MACIPNIPLTKELSRPTIRSSVYLLNESFTWRVAVDSVKTIYLSQLFPPPHHKNNHVDRPQHIFESTVHQHVCPGFLGIKLYAGV